MSQPTLATTHAPRIVSLLPSVTEIVVALGLGEHLVARSHQCDFPPQVTHLPALSRSRIAPGGSAREIHQRVGEVLQQGLAMYEVDAARLQALAPHYILSQTQCAICAVTPGDLQSALAAWPAATPRPQVVSVEPADLAEVFEVIRHLGRVLQVPERGEQVAATLAARISALARRTAGLARPSMVALEWTDPLIAAGNWVPELIECAGGRCVLGTRGEESPALPFAELEAADPDVIVITPCGFTLADGIAELELLARQPQWAGLRAVRDRRVYVVDGVHYFNRPGPRLVESAEILAEILHPQACDFGHRDKAWIPATPWLPRAA